MTSKGPYKDDNNTGGLNEDDLWGSDFDEPIEELYSQEIEDNKINETREAQLRKVLVENAPIPITSLENTRERTTIIENASCSSSPSSGAIPKRGFSYLNNFHLGTQNSLTNSILFQKKRNSLSGDQDLQIVLGTNNKVIHVTSPPSATPLSDTKTEINELLYKKINPKDLRRKPKKEAINFRNSNPTTPLFSVKNNEKNENDDLRAFIDQNLPEQVDIAQHSQFPTAEPSSHEINNCETNRTAPPLIDTDNYEEIPNEIRLGILQETKPQGLKPETNRDLNESKEPPPLPSRPPPIFKYPPGVFSKPLIPPKKTKPIKLQAEVSAPQLPVRVSGVSMIGYVKTTEQEDVNATKNHKRDMTKTRNQYKTSEMTLDIFSRPLPPIPVSDCLKVRKSLSQENEEQCKITMTDKLAAEINFSSTQPRASPSASEFVPQTLKPIPNPQKSFDERLISLESQSFHSEKSPQKRLAEVIGNQSNVVDATVLLTQRKIAPAIASRVAKLQKGLADSTNTDSYETPIQEIKDDTSCLSKSQRSRKSSDEIPKAGVSERQPPNFCMRENSSPLPFADIEALRNTISRPSLPQKLRNTQRSVSCSSLVQSFKDLSFTIWSPLDKDKRISTGSNALEKTIKDFTKHTIGPVMKEFSPIPTVDVSLEATSPKPMAHVPEISAQKSTLSQNAWYHDVDAWEAQRRLTSFLDQNGAFLIRPSTRKNNEIQHTACIVFSGRIINMHIRRKPSGQYALGKEKEREKTFPSLADLIKCYQEVPIEVQTSSHSLSKSQTFSTCLRVTPPKIWT